MAKENDIVVRFRSFAKTLRKNGALRCEDKDFEEAAQEIEDLQAQVEALLEKQGK